MSEEQNPVRAAYERQPDHWYQRHRQIREHHSEEARRVVRQSNNKGATEYLSQYNRRKH